MARFIIRSIISTIVTMLLVSLLLFVLIDVGSGDITVKILGIESTAEQRASYRAQLGLDAPLLQRYLDWLIGNDWQNDPDLLPRKGLLRGDFGNSLIEKRPVGEMITERLGHTLLLTGTATLIGYLLGIPIGVYAAVSQGGVFDNFSRIL